MHSYLVYLTLHIIFSVVSLKSFFQLDHQVDICLYLTEATALSAIDNQPVQHQL